MATAELPVESPPAEPLTSLRAIRAAHTELLQQVPADRIDAPQIALIADFLNRSAAAGAFLDLPEDRAAAQGLLDYWKSSLYSQRRQAAFGEGAVRLPAATLADFSPAAVEEIVKSAEARLVGDQKVQAARNLLLKLIQLPAERGTPQTDEVERSKLLEREPRAAEQVLADLEAAGVLERFGDPPRVRLRADALLRRWPRLAAWLEKRLLFREAALFWDRHNRDRGALFTRELLAQSHPYHNENALESEFVKAVNAEADRQEALHRQQLRTWRRVAVAMGVMVLLDFVCLGYVAVTFSQRQQLAIEQKELAEAKLRQGRMMNMVGLLRALGNIAAAESPAERQLAIKGWEVLEARGADDPEIAAFLKSFAGQIRTIATDRQRHANSAVQSMQYKELQGEVLELATAFRDDVVKSRDDASIQRLSELREDYYSIIRFLVEKIVAAAQSGDSASSVQPYLREFWQLYWGEMGLVEGPDVKTGMVQFGNRLWIWSEHAAGRNEPFKDLDGPAQRLFESLEKELKLPIEPSTPPAASL